jgi:HD-GYP domain-containing protein (c-di-GMP phosphodiesterase class II)
MSIEFAESERAAGEAFLRLAAGVDEFEGYAHPHASRVARLADALAAGFRLSRADRTSVVFAALLHDLGEMTMGREYIKRDGPLNVAERLDLARHPVIGEQEAARAGADRAVQLLVRWHHEWFGGGGYPDALRGEQIPLGARILRVADAYAALTDARPWRPAGTESEARKHLGLWAGIEFDPRVVRAFLSLEGLPELRSHARERVAEAPAAAAETGAEETPSEPAREAPPEAVREGEEVVHAGEPPVQYPWDSRP